MRNPILIVGAGPVGLTLACELARYRLPVRIVDKAPARSDQSRALAVWPRTLELLDRTGCVEAFTRAGLHGRGAGFYERDEPIAKVSFDTLESAFRYVLLIPQSETERLLDAHLHVLGGQVERSVQLTAFVPASDRVTCTLRHADGSDETIEASVLVGCDGAHSFVRESLAMPFDGDTLPGHFVLADVHLAGGRLPADEVAIVLHEDGTLAFFPIAPGRYRVIADVGAEPRHDPTFAEIQTLVARRGPAGITLSNPLWLSGFGVNERKVASFRAGRVFVAGDAAHVHSPAGGQGMNTGMQDAFNLAWKLALVERGLAKPSLLDSYSDERSAVARRILADSGKMIRMATLRNAVAQYARNFVAHRLLGLPFVQRAAASRLAEIAIGYAGSPLNVGSADGLAGPAPGQRIVDSHPFGAGDTPRFAVMANDSPGIRAMLARYADLVEPSPRAPPDPAGLWLVRPDGYVAAVARADDPALIATCLARIAR
ncbi:MAG: FAD-dependent monooxygenase [Burkholderiales bacterium]|nr:FAD-dependent monooxygenase [Burkholderiales bacterium]